MVRIGVLKIKDKRVVISGKGPRIPVGKDRSLKILNEKGEEIPKETFPMPYDDKLDDEGNLKAASWGFRAELPVRGGARYSFYLGKTSPKGKTEWTKQELRFGSRSMLQNTDVSFIDEGDFIIQHIDSEIRVSKADFRTRLACRHRLEKTLKKEGKAYLIPLRRYAEKNRGKGKPVVIIADRVNRAGDNGEALFRYLMEEGYDADFDIFFAVKKDSPDYERMKKIGRVLDFGSDEYKEKFLIADKVITAGFDKWFGNAFADDMKYMADLYSFDHCFLQHGVIMNDLSKSLNYYKKGFELFCTSTEAERRSILDGNYGYHEDEVRLTGLARYDLLEDEAEKLIVFAPTWRINLAGEIDEEHGARFRSELIPESEYCRFYNGLINDGRLTEFMREHGYRGEFYLHPSFTENLSDFHGNDIVDVCKDADYNRIFRKAAILITDYSSVNIDFAYLDKPLIYSQFDREEFFRDHLAGHGYFDYEQDGFGPVCVTIDEVVDEIISIMERGCTNDPVYSERAESFFRFRDRNNRKRIAEALF